MLQRALPRTVHRQGCLKHDMTQLYQRSGGRPEHLERLMPPEVAVVAVVPWTAMVAGLVSQELYRDAILVFRQMQLQGIAPNRVTIMTALSACLNLASLPLLRHLAAIAGDAHLAGDIAIATSLLNIHGKLGSLAAAREIFEAMEVKSVVAWTAMMAACVANGEDEEALGFFQRMLLEHSIANTVSFITILGACRDCRDGASIHGWAVESGIFGSSVFARTAVVTMYGRCGGVDLAKDAFDSIEEKNFISWNAMAAAFARNGHCREAMEMVRGMELQGFHPDRVTWLSVLVPEMDLSAARWIHSRIVGSGIEMDCALGTALLCVYARNRCLEEVLWIFSREMISRSWISWNSMLAAVVSCGGASTSLVHFLIREMRLEGMVQNEASVFSCLGACSSTGSSEREGETVLTSAKELGFRLERALRATAVVTFFRRYGKVAEAREIFDGVPNEDKDLPLWGTMIAAYADHLQLCDAMALLQRMQQFGVRPSKVVVVAVINLCAAVADLRQGKALRSLFVDLCETMRSSVVVANALVDMYGKCGELEVARTLFREIPEKDSVSWSSMVSVLRDHGRGEEALEFVREMMLEGMASSSVGFLAVLSSGFMELREVETFEAILAELGMDENAATSLVAAYGKCGDLRNARRVFDETSISHRAVAWNCLLSIHSENRELERAYKLFLEMLLNGVTPERITFITTLSALVESSGQDLRSLDTIVACIVETGMKTDLVVGNALISAFGKCSSPEKAREIFDAMIEHNKVSWTAIISAYVLGNQRENGLLAKFFFRRMMLQGDRPDRVTFATILATCTTATALADGKLFHGWISEDSTLEMDPVVVSALINMYSKCGSLPFARKVFEQAEELLPQNVLVWTSMISAYAHHGDGDQALKLFARTQQAGMRADYVTIVSVLSACTKAGNLHTGVEFFISMTQDHCVEATLEHYSCLVDLLGRAGELELVEELVRKIPDRARSARALVSYLSSCRVHGNVELGRAAARGVDPSIPAGYVGLSNLVLATVDQQEHVESNLVRPQNLTM